MIVVTGASGFLGGGLATALALRGDKVRAVQRSDVPKLRELGVEVSTVSRPKHCCPTFKQPAYQLIVVPWVSS